jgi:AAA family ATP:ADP antiporter
VRFDVVLGSRATSQFVLCRGTAAPVQNRLIKALYGEISVDELRKFSLLALIFLFIIGSYWLLRPLKDAVFFTIVGGKHYQPYAKMLSVVVVVLVVLVYSRLVDLFSRERLFYIVLAFFALSFFALTALLAHPTIGIDNTGECDLCR